MNDVEAHLTLHAGEPGDRETACIDLYQRHAPWLIAALEKRGLHAEFADHGACQALHQLFQLFEVDGEFDSASTDVVRRWLYKVGRDTAIDEMRRIWKLRSGADTFGFSEITDANNPSIEREDATHASGSDVLQAKETCRQLWECIQELRADEKFILLQDMQVLAALREYGGIESDLYDEDLASSPGADVALSGALRVKRSRILKKLQAKIGRSKDE